MHREVPRNLIIIIAELPATSLDSTFFSPIRKYTWKHDNLLFLFVSLVLIKLEFFLCGAEIIWNPSRRSLYHCVFELCWAKFGARIDSGIGALVIIYLIYIKNTIGKFISGQFTNIGGEANLLTGFFGWDLCIQSVINAKNISWDILLIWKCSLLSLFPSYVLTSRLQITEHKLYWTHQ